MRVAPLQYFGQWHAVPAVQNRVVVLIIQIKVLETHKKLSGARIALQSGQSANFPIPERSNVSSIVPLPNPQFRIVSVASVLGQPKVRQATRWVANANSTRKPVLADAALCHWGKTLG
jgi:hypothetical protein